MASVNPAGVEPVGMPSLAHGNPRSTVLGRLFHLRTTFRKALLVSPTPSRNSLWA